MKKSANNGFTLVELLVALFVFAILAITAYRGLNAVTQTRTRIDQETRKWQALERFFARLDGETAQVLHGNRGGSTCLGGYAVHHKQSGRYATGIHAQRRF